MKIQSLVPLFDLHFSKKARNWLIFCHLLTLGLFVVSGYEVYVGRISLAALFFSGLVFQVLLAVVALYALRPLVSAAQMLYSARPSDAHYLDPKKIGKDAFLNWDKRSLF